MFNECKMMFFWPVNGAASLLIALLFLQSHIQSHGQAGFDPAYSYSMSGMAPLPASPMGYTHSMHHLPQDKTEVILVGDRGGNQHHHHHHHHHHKNVHHHHHGHQHSHGHNHNHDHKHDHDHKHGHNHNHKHGHKHDHKHAHGHNHHHNHAHGHLHNHGHHHNHKHAHIQLHRGQKHSYQQKHGHFHHHGHNHKNGFGNNNDYYQINGNDYFFKQKDKQHDVQHQDQYDSEHFNPIPPINQLHSNQHISNQQEYQHNNLQHSNHYTKYPDHVPPSYVSTDSDSSIPHNKKYNNAQQENNFKVQYDETEQGDGHKDHYDHSTSNENASYETKEEDNSHDEHSHSNEDTLNKPGVQHEEEDVNKGVSSASEQDKALSRYFRSKLNNMSLKQPRSTAPPTRKSPQFPKSNIPSDRSDSHRLKELDQNSDELSVEPQVHYGVRLRQNGYDDYHKKEASISAVTFLQENGGLITVGDDDPYLSVEKPLKLEDSDPHRGHHGESLESKLSSGRMTLTPEEDYRASIGKIDEVWNIPLFD